MPYKYSWTSIIQNALFIKRKRYVHLDHENLPFKSCHITRSLVSYSSDLSTALLYFQQKFNWLEGESRGPCSQFPLRVCFNAKGSSAGCPHGDRTFHQNNNNKNGGGELGRGWLTVAASEIALTWKAFSVSKGTTTASEKAITPSPLLTFEIHTPVHGAVSRVAHPSPESITWRI